MSNRIIAAAAISGVFSLAMGAAALAQGPAAGGMRAIGTLASDRPLILAQAVVPDRQDRRENRLNELKQDTTAQGAAGGPTPKPPPGVRAPTRQDARQQRVNEEKQDTTAQGAAGGPNPKPPMAAGGPTRRDDRQQRVNRAKQKTTDQGAAGGPKR